MKRGQSWTVGEKGVVDSRGDDGARGVEPWGSGGEWCGVRISEYRPENHAGDWRCDLGYARATSLYGRVSTGRRVRDNLRLPGGGVLRPLNYSVDLVPDLDGGVRDVGPPGDRFGFRFNGSSRMRLVAGETLARVVLHSDGLAVKRVVVNSLGQGGLHKVAKLGFDFQRTFVEVVLSRSLQRGQVFEIGIDFEADAVRKKTNSPGIFTNYGLYPAKCSKSDNSVCWFTQLQPTYARSTFPCLDEPALKAKFDIRVGRTAAYRSLSNMPRVKTTPMAGREGWYWDTFATTVKMSPYLVAVAVTSNYKSASSALYNLSVWAPGESIVSGHGDHAVSAGTRLMRYYEDLFGVAYPLPKMDMVSVPQQGGAMENWGLMVFEPRLLLLSNSSSDAHRWKVTSLVAHELVHQWFGNLVTNKWWDQIWLNEGFANYLEFYGADYIHPKDNSWGRFITRIMQTAMYYDSRTGYGWAMSTMVYSRKDIVNKFDFVSYKKAASIIRMMEFIISKEAFMKGLSNYLTKLSYYHATEDDLFLHLEKSAKKTGTWPQQTAKSFGQVMKSWTQQPGYPLVTVRKGCHGSQCTINLSQNRFLMYSRSTASQTWDVPITYTTVNGSHDDWSVKTPSHWISGNETVSIKVPNSSANIPVVINVQAYGYFRVNYDNATWHQLANILR